MTNPKKINVDDNGNITSMTVVKMELGEPDASGRRRPVEIEGSEYDIEVDTVIMSLGTSPNPLISSTTKGLDVNRRKCIVADEENGQTSKKVCLQAAMLLQVPLRLYLQWEQERRSKRN